ncbi:hypothetical protein [Limnoglobus roseus]|uniref:Uncharacterized protein n=1 Tax=Limnoglobus roseus TaxID=2598579 RepID=A0A5C1AUM1_9BACT|nr:hypothetical protein [Limnoglobus roseus]QEL20478.1 hypothetical protein PX52LOC_07579 [Limnoglobus roseus]
MRLRGRLDQLTNRVRSTRPDAPPLTVFLIEATVDRPVGTQSVWGGIAREICYDPTAGPPVLPPSGPHKIVFGPEFDV